MTKQECHSKLSARVSIAGDYNNHECSIRIKNVDIGDAGTWKCKVDHKSFICEIMFNLSFILDGELCQWNRSRIHQNKIPGYCYCRENNHNRSCHREYNNRNQYNNHHDNYNNNCTCNNYNYNNSCQ